MNGGGQTNLHAEENRSCSYSALEVGHKSPFLQCGLRTVGWGKRSDLMNKH